MWHKRLGYRHQIKRIAEFVEGILKQISNLQPHIHPCLVCKQQIKRKPVTNIAPLQDPPTHNYQHISIDFGFITQQSKNVDRYKSLEGVDGENCYVLLKCRKSRLKSTKPAKNKTPPIKWLSKFLAAHAPDKLKVGHMICHMDKGGDLGKSTQVCKLLSYYGYSIETFSHWKTMSK